MRYNKIYDCKDYVLKPKQSRQGHGFSRCRVDDQDAAYRVVE